MEKCDLHGDKVLVIYSVGECPLCDAMRQIDEWEKKDASQAMSPLEFARFYGRSLTETQEVQNENP